MIITWRQKLIIMTGPTVAVGLIVALGLVYILPTPNARALGYLITTSLMTLALVIELILGMGKVSAEKIRICIPPVLLAVSSAAWLALAETMLGKGAVVLAAFLLIGYYQSYLLVRQKSTEESSEESGGEFLNSRPGLPQAAFITDLFAVFFLTAFIFGLDGFYNIPMPLSAILAGLLWGGLAHENLWRFGAKQADRRVLGAVFGVVGAEMHLGLSFLPISYLAEAAVATIILTIGLQLTRQVIFGVAETRKFRGQALAIIALIILLFFTTKWT